VATLADGSIDEEEEEKEEGEGEGGDDEDEDELIGCSQFTGVTEARFVAVTMPVFKLLGLLHAVVGLGGLLESTFVALDSFTIGSTSASSSKSGT
jgi:hypothetical protein